jgi:hypothetical protein
MACATIRRKTVTSRSDVEAAWRLIRPYIRRTPAIELASGAP